MIDLNYMTETLDSLPMVEWDRCVLMDEYDHAMVYGWIKDKGKRPDFVTVGFWFEEHSDGTNDHHTHNYTTSSARWSQEINEILLPGTDHLECQTVQDMLPDLKRKVHR